MFVAALLVVFVFAVLELVVALLLFVSAAFVFGASLLGAADLDCVDGASDLLVVVGAFIPPPPTLAFAMPIPLKAKTHTITIAKIFLKFNLYTLTSKKFNSF